MTSRGKKYEAARSKVDRTKRYSVDEAATLLKETHAKKFDESVDIAVRLGVNPKHADQMVRGAVVLPHGTGSSVRVCVIAKGDKAAAQKAYRVTVSIIDKAAAKKTIHKNTAARYKSRLNVRVEKAGK